MPGPLPKPNARRRNAPTIPTTDLPAGGRKGPAPKLPAGYELGADGLAWWGWAWRTPQSAAWSDGDLYVVARRAGLEDALGALRQADLGVDVGELLDDETGDALRWLVGRLKALAVGELQVAKEARELDDRLGLTPKGLAALRWKIVPDVVEVRPQRTVGSPRERLRAVK